MSRDRTVGNTFYFAFTTRAFATGIPTVLAGSPVVSAYEDASLTQITAGITLGLDHDSVAGLNMLTLVATGGNGFESGKDYNLVVTTGTVGGVSVVGEVVGQFSLGLSAAAVDLANGTDGLTALKTGLDDVPTVSEFNARTIVSSDYFDPATDAVANVTLVATTTDVTNQVAADVTAISGDSTAADNLEASLETLVTGTATGTPTTTTMADSTLTEATDNHYNGRVIIWRTGALAGQATDITAYNGTTKTFTFTATTDAAVASDAYVVV